MRYAEVTLNTCFEISRISQDTAEQHTSTRHVYVVYISVNDGLAAKSAVRHQSAGHIFISDPQQHGRSSDSSSERYR